MKRLSFEQVARRQEARRCAADLRTLGVHLCLRDVLSYWGGIERQYYMSYYRWLDRCRFARLRAADAGAQAQEEHAG